MTAGKTLIMLINKKWGLKPEEKHQTDSSDKITVLENALEKVSISRNKEEILELFEK